MIKIYTLPKKNEIALVIEDNGIGISSADLPRVTEKGFTGSLGRKYAKSTGMGLYLCHTLCEKMGLFLSIDSVLGRGTTVNIMFPSR